MRVVHLARDTHELRKNDERKRKMSIRVNRGEGYIRMSRDTYGFTYRKSWPDFWIFSSTPATPDAQEF